MAREPAGSVGLSTVLLAVTLSASLGGSLLTVHTGAPSSLWWTSAGVGVSLLLTAPRTWWPALLGLVFAGYVATGLTEGPGLVAAVLTAAVGTAEILAVGLGVRRFIGYRIETLQRFFRLLAITAVTALAGSIGYALIAETVPDRHFQLVLIPTFSSHFTWMVLVACYILTPVGRYPARWRAVAAQTTAIVVLTVAVFRPDQALPLASLVIPVAVSAALVVPLRTVVLQQLVLAGYVSAATLLGWGPFADADHLYRSYALSQAYLVGTAVVTLAFALALGEQRDAIAAAVEQRRRAEAVMDSSRTAIVLVDADGIIQSVNPTTVSITGYDEQQLLGRSLWEAFIPALDQGRARDRFIDQRGINRQDESVIRRADGEYRTVAYSVGLLSGADSPESARYVLTAVDVTVERTRSSLLDHLLGSQTSVAIVATTTDGRITLWNAGAQAVLGLDPVEAAAHVFTDFLDPTEVANRAADRGLPPSFDAVVADLADGGTLDTEDWTFVPTVGDHLTVSMNRSVVHDDAGYTLGYLFVARDVTEIRHNQELLLEALEREQAAVGHLRTLDQAKDDFVSTVSHELRTPLTSILGSIEMMAEGMAGTLSEQQRQLTGVIDRNCHRLLDLVDDLLLVATFESGGPPRRDDLIDLRGVVETVHTGAATMATRAQIVLEEHLPAEPVVVRGDATFLERAVSNLVVNAIKFSPDGGRVTTRLAKRDGVCHLAVTDHGLGIAAEDRPRLFERFFRADTTQGRAIQGTGLGLPIVKSVVENHGGSIELHSELGVGSTFTIVLPLA